MSAPSEFPLPGYLTVTQAQLGSGSGAQVRVVESMADVAQAMADDMMNVIDASLASRGTAVLIIPVGPVDQFPLLSQAINRRNVSLKHVVLINMDEYLTDDDQWVSTAHPLSFRSYMQRSFYDLLNPDLAPPPSQRIFPDPRDVDAVPRLIDQFGGVDACFAGIGINGHVAFNEPPEPGEIVSDADFLQYPTRVLSLSRETRTINANTVGGSLEVIPHRCVTIGMREILASRSIHVYCNRPWQSAVIRRILHGPRSAACPASLLRGHAELRFTLASYVAASPEIRLR